MSPAVRDALVRLRVLALVHGAAWCVALATFVAMFLAEPGFLALGVESEDSPRSNVSPLFFVAFGFAFVTKAPFVWACATLARRAGIAGLSPTLIAVVAFVLPWFPTWRTVRSASDAVLRIDDRAGERLPNALAFAGIYATVGCLALLPVFGTTEVGDTPGAVLVFFGAALLYGVARLLIALRLRASITSALSRPAVDELRASHAEPVGGG